MKFHSNIINMDIRYLARPFQIRDKLYKTQKDSCSNNEILFTTIQCTHGNYKDIKDRPVI